MSQISQQWKGKASGISKQKMSCRLGSARNSSWVWPWELQPTLGWVIKPGRSQSSWPLVLSSKGLKPPTKEGQALVATVPSLPYSPSPTLQPNRVLAGPFHQPAHAKREDELAHSPSHSPPQLGCGQVHAGLSQEEWDSPAVSLGTVTLHHWEHLRSHNGYFQIHVKACCFQRDLPCWLYRNSVRDYMADPGCCDLMNVFTGLCPLNDDSCFLKQNHI